MNECVLKKECVVNEIENLLFADKENVNVIMIWSLTKEMYINNTSHSHGQPTQQQAMYFPIGSLHSCLPGWRIHT